MILEEETFEAFNHYPSELKHGSHKLILAACLDCGKTRAVEKRQYRELCKACADKANLNRLGATNTEEHNIKISAARKGKYIGKKNPNWSGGKELARKRHSASRRQLGYSPLLPLGIGEVGHHITNEYVIGIPKEVVSFKLPFSGA